MSPTTRTRLSSNLLRSKAIDILYHPQLLLFAALSGEQFPFDYSGPEMDNEDMCFLYSGCRGMRHYHRNINPRSQLPAVASEKSDGPNSHFSRRFNGENHIF